MKFPSRDAAIVGVYTTEQARFMQRSSHSLQLEAIKGALDDAGLTIADVDGIVSMGESPDGSRRPEQYWATQLGGRPFTFAQMGSPSPSVVKAALGVSAGMADVVVVFWGKSHRQLGPNGTPVPDQAPPRVHPWGFNVMGGFMAPWYAMWARRYMNDYGATNADLAEVGVVARYHATLKPDSLMGHRGEITVDDVLNSRMIAEPLHLFDCAVDNDGGYAIVVASADVARNCKTKPVWIIGGAEATHTDFYETIDLPWFPEEGASVRRVGDIAFAQAGISRDDIDVANLYDCFSITMIRNLEELGFCKLGEGIDYFKEGHTRLGGSMPSNTDGGLLSNSHNGMPHGMQAIEVTHQLRGECGPRQVTNAHIGLAFAQGASVHGYAGTAILAAD